MIAFEKACIEHNPALVVVIGDVNSTLACAISAKKLRIPLVHVEEGLRSRDMSMPEEINRLCTDVIGDFLFTTDELAGANLLAEGCGPESIQFVGNTMIDSLKNHLSRAPADDGYSMQLTQSPHTFQLSSRLILVPRSEWPRSNFTMASE
jgi:UDP-N-acetylglucosamine 2-epimerase (non-hydrolysing)